METYDAIIIGGGSAGMAAAVTLHDQGVKNVLILERQGELGGILMQCIHNGFGLKVFGEELTGPEYAERYIKLVKERDIEVKLGTAVMAVHPDRTIDIVNPRGGFRSIRGKAILLTVGCYERNRGSISIPGSRPKGVYTAGTAQKYLNMDGYLVGKRVFILGSGDIGLIMARRMTLEGAKVLGVAEIQPHSGGLKRNIVQCLEDYDIPLYLSHTVTDIIGDEVLERIVLSEVDGFMPIPGTERTIEVDTLLLSVGLIPENGIAEMAGVVLDPTTKGPVVDDRYMTNIDGIFASGNALHVHDLVDYVTEESVRAAQAIVTYLRNPVTSRPVSDIHAGPGVRYVVPQRFHQEQEGALELFLRVEREYRDVVLRVMEGTRELKRLRKRHMAPAEMERIRLDRTDMTDHQDLRIEVMEP